MQGVKEGEHAVAASGGRIHARLLLCAMRHADRAAEIAQITVDNYGAHSPGEGHVVGFDIAGAEDGFPPSNHVEAFRILRENLVPVTVHAGEAAGVESIADGLRRGAVRIGHGVRIYEDFEATMNGIELGPVATFVRDRQIPLEICPTSNTQTGVCETVAEHPFNLLYELGFACTVNTDNRLVSGCTMSSEFEALAEAFGMEYWQFLEMTTNALDNAFCDQPLRETLEREVITRPTPSSAIPWARLLATARGPLVGWGSSTVRGSTVTSTGRASALKRSSCPWRTCVPNWRHWG